MQLLLPGPILFEVVLCREECMYVSLTIAVQGHLSTCHLHRRCTTFGYTDLHPLTPAISVTWLLYIACQKKFMWVGQRGRTVPSSLIIALICALGHRSWTLVKNNVNVPSSSRLEMSHATGYPLGRLCNISESHSTYCGHKLHKERTSTKLISNHQCYQLVSVLISVVGWIETNDSLWIRFEQFSLEFSHNS